MVGDIYIYMIIYIYIILDIYIIHIILTDLQ